MYKSIYVWTAKTVNYYYILGLILFPVRLSQNNSILSCEIEFEIICSIQSVGYTKLRGRLRYIVVKEYNFWGVPDIFCIRWIIQQYTPRDATIQFPPSS